MSSGDDLIRAKVFPKSKSPRVSVSEDGCYRVYVTSAPDKGKANREFVTELAKHLGVRKSDIRIVRGERSRNKLIKGCR